MGLAAGESGICPHCKTGVRFETVQVNGTNGVTVLSINTPSNHLLQLNVCACPTCGRPIVIAAKLRPGPANPIISVQSLVWPDSLSRFIPSEVEAAAPILAADFREAVAVLPKSKKASAALSRRCLQFVLVHKGGVKKKDLADQIEEVLSSLPAELALNVDAIRHVGNFAAHPVKSKSSGEIAEVEEGEAEWLLDVLEELFEHYYVAPAQAADRRASLNKKLAELGKPPLKTP